MDLKIIVEDLDRETVTKTGRLYNTGAENLMMGML